MLDCLFIVDLTKLIAGLENERQREDIADEAQKLCTDVRVWKWGFGEVLQKVVCTIGYTRGKSICPYFYGRIHQ